MLSSQLLTHHDSRCKHFYPFQHLVIMLFGIFFSHLFCICILLVFGFSLFRIFYAATFICVLSCSLSLVLCCKLCCNLQAIASKRRIPTPRLNARTLHATYSHSLCRLYWLNQNFFVSLALTVLSLFNCYSAHVVGPSAVWSCVFVSFLALLLVLMPFFYCQQFMLCLEFFTLHIFTFFFCFFFLSIFSATL